MNRLTKLATAFVLLTAGSHASAETIERIAAVAGNDIITMQDVRTEGKLKYAVKGLDITLIDDMPDRADQLEKLVRELVRSRLVARQARKNNISIGDREVDMQLRQMYRQSGQGEEAYKAMIAQEGMDWESYREYIRGEIEAQYVIRSELAGQVSPSESDVIACAREEAPGEEKSIVVTLRQIIIPEIEGDSSAGLGAPAGRIINAVWWNTLDNAMKRYASGIREIAAKNSDRFVDYVGLYSTGRSAERAGLLGSFSPGDLSGDFAPVFALKTGEVAPLITTGAGYHIIKADEVSYGESELWKKAVERCREQITMREGQRLIETWFNDLMERNYVSIMINNNIDEAAAPKK